jgi:hypothetical protein
VAVGIFVFVALVNAAAVWHLPALQAWWPAVAIFLVGFYIGCVRAVAMILAVCTPCEILRDLALEVSDRARADLRSTSAETAASKAEVEALLSAARIIGQRVAQTQRVLHPVLLSMICWSAVSVCKRASNQRAAA